MRLLRAKVCQRRYHSQQGFEARHGETTQRRRERGRARETRGRHGNHPFDAWREPHDTDTPKPLLRRDLNQREGEAIQWVRWISHLYCIGGKCCKLEEGILL